MSGGRGLSPIHQVETPNCQISKAHHKATTSSIGGTGVTFVNSRLDERKGVKIPMPAPNLRRRGGRGPKMWPRRAPTPARARAYQCNLKTKINQRRERRPQPKIQRLQVSDRVLDRLRQGVERVQIAGYSALGNYAIPGEAFGVIYGESFLKNDEGQYIVDGAGNYQASGNFEVIGDPNPNFTANWINNISFKGISFGFQWQYIDGGDIYSSTVQSLMARGNTVDTDVDRTIPLIMPNAVKADGTPNDIQTYIGDSFFRAYFFADEGGIFDGTVIRLREVSLAYSIPKKALANSPFGRIGIAFSGQNLFYNAPNFPEGINFDPEVLSVGVGNGRGFDFRTAPTGKKYGIVLNASF